MNLYVPSRAEWAEAGAVVTQETDFPEGESARLTVALAAPRRFTLAVRRPGWAEAGFTVTVDGEEVRDLPAPPAFVRIDRLWKDGDVVRVTLPKTLRLEPTPDDPRRVAILWGPLVLAANLGLEPEPWEEERHAGLAQMPPLLVGERPVADWVTPIPDRPGEFRTKGALEGRDVPLVPFYRLHRRVYAAYFDRFTPAEWEGEVAARAEARSRQRELERATVAYVEPGDAQAERDFALQGEGHAVFVEPISGRRARRSKQWLSVQVPVDAAQPAALVVTYHSDQPRERRFEVLVEGTRVGEETFPGAGTSRFFDVEYPLPASLVAGRQRVTVRFQAAPGREVAPVFGVRSVRRPGSQ